MSIPILVFVLSIKSLVVALGTLAFQKTIGDFASNLSKISALQVCVFVLFQLIYSLILVLISLCVSLDIF